MSSPLVVIETDPGVCAMAPLTYRLFKLGKIRLYEWLFDQLQFQADG
jgi:hypothetical protein